jgi:hypothetical protein
MGQPTHHTIMGDSMGHVETSHMKILDTPDSQSLLAQMTVLDVQIQARFYSFYNDPIPEMQRWFAQPADHVALETLDFKQQWLKIVDSALKYYR